MLAAIIFSGLASPSLVWAENVSEVTLPASPQEHLALAEQYDQKARSAREEAAYHRAMEQAAKRKVGHSRRRRGRAGYEQMRRHCQSIIRNAERLAKDMEKLAALHRQMAQEVDAGLAGDE
jgi:molybdenum-dependent DNA-binding transcriptional regulator ModE